MDWEKGRRGGMIEDQRVTWLQQALGLPTNTLQAGAKLPTLNQKAGAGRADAVRQQELQAARYQNWIELQQHPEWMNLPAAGPERRTTAVVNRMNPLIKAIGR